MDGWTADTANSCGKQPYSAIFRRLDFRFEHVRFDIADHGCSKMRCCQVGRGYLDEKRVGLQRYWGEEVHFTQDQLQAIADALADTSEGLTGTEIGFLLQTCKIMDTDPAMTKRHRLYNAFAHEQNQSKERTRILAFIRKAMKPTRFARETARFEPMRANLNRALAFAGMSVDATGTLGSATRAGTLGEAERRARDLRADLLSRGVHPDVLSFCKEELLHDNYFHAVLEAVKSVADKVRRRTGLMDDGAALVDRAFSGSPPMLGINALRTKSEQDEQKGFSNLLKGTFGMFRNPAAHEAKINWTISKDDAEDLLSLVSLIHRRIDAATMPPRV